MLISYKLRAPLLLIIFALCNLGCTTFSHPTDAALEKAYRESRTDFHLLAKMASEDAQIWRITSGGFEVYADATRRATRDGSTSDLDAARLGEYRRLFGKLGLAGLSKAGSPTGDVIRFAASSAQQGLLHGDVKGYAYASDGVPTPLYESLDDKATDKRGDPQPLYKAIEDKWYLFYVRD